MSKKKLYSSVLFVYLLSLLVFAPIVFGEKIRYYTFIYFLFFSFVLIVFKSPRLFIWRIWPFWLLVGVNLVWIAFYIGDSSSVINLATLTLSYLSIFVIVSKGVEVCGEDALLHLIFKYFGWIIAISFFLSLVLTLIQWPGNAPEYFPWEAFYTDKRLLLLIGQNTGHSYVLWLMALFSAYIISFQRRTNNQWNIPATFILLMLFFGLVATKSRLAIIFILILVLSWMCYQSLITKKIFSIAVLIAPPLFIITAVNPSIQTSFEGLMVEVQSKVTGIRVTPTLSGEGGYTIYSGREVLNNMLIDGVLRIKLLHLE